MARPAYLLPVIICSQFAGTSLWFAGNAVVADLQHQWGLSDGSVGAVTSAVQLGFILGTLAFAVLMLADRFSPRRVFFLCCLAGACANGLLLLSPPDRIWLLASRFATGFFLAGIYPVGMKIASGWFEKGLGRALGYLVGALVLGTALPHLLRAGGAELPWQPVILGTSLIAGLGGVLMLLAPDGPFLSGGARFDPRAVAVIFRSRAFRASAFGYFGHMWELYTFWAFLPLWLTAYIAHESVRLNVSLLSFIVIAIGFLGCAAGGEISRTWGSARVAGSQLLISGVCCALSPLLFWADWPILMAFLLVWGISVVGDSPQFSALNAANAPPKLVGSALTLANCIGFAITVVSIQLVNALWPLIGAQFVFWLLIPGPVLGLLALRPLLRRAPD